MRRHRRTPPPGEFEDPLQNYDGPDFADDFERSLCEDIAGDLALTPCHAVTADTPVREVLILMNTEQVGAVVVVGSDSHPVGIFSERDVLNRLAGLYAHLKNRPISEVMTPEPAVAYRTDPPSRVLNMMATGGYRHVPVVDADEKLLGIIGARRITEYMEKHFT